MNETELWQFTVWLKPGRRQPRWWHFLLPKPREPDSYALDAAIKGLQDRFAPGGIEHKHRAFSDVIAITLSGLPFPEDSLALMWDRITNTVASKAALIPVGVYKVGPVGKKRA